MEGIALAIAGIVEATAAVVSFAIETIVWSIIGIWKLLQAAFNPEKRDEIKAEWKNSRTGRLKIIGSVVVWVPILALGGFFSYFIFEVFGGEEKKHYGENQKAKTSITLSIPQNAQDEEVKIKVSFDANALEQIKDSELMNNVSDWVREKFSEQKQSQPDTVVDSANAP